VDVMLHYVNGDFKIKQIIYYFKINYQLLDGLVELIFNLLLWQLEQELFQDFNKLLPKN
jgi:hypothetical protein